MSSPDLPAAASPPQPPATVGGLRKKTLAIVGVVTVAIWAFAIQTGSLVLMSIVGGLTVILVALLVWAIRMGRRQQGLVSLLQSAGSSPEARREALARLEGDKNKSDVTHVFARAQLEAAEDPARALATLESLDWKKVPAQMQDDVAILQTQLYLQFGRAKDARRLADSINLDSPARKQMRGMMVAVVGECWARSGKHADALALLDKVDLAKEADEQVRMQLMIARAFANFASGKRGAARADLGAIADVNLQYLGRFLMPQFRVHPELQKLARQVAERNPAALRKLGGPAAPRRGRPR